MWQLASSLAAAPYIPAWRLLIALSPVVVVLWVLSTWSLGIRTSLFAICRMFIQLMLLGYALVYLFDESLPWTLQLVIVLCVLPLMLMAASWSSLRVAAERRRELLPKVLVSVGAGGGLTLLVITQGVIQPDPWYSPRILVPLAGMIFSNCMNAVSLAIERYCAETDRGESPTTAKKTAFEASLIPITNSLFAVGLVAIPGMMTGQLLSAESPVNAARYQIMVMMMMFGSAGMSAALCLKLMSSDSTAKEATGL